jgi:hypothetical protein
MNQSRGCEQRPSELIGVDLPAGELKRLARVDALLREAVAGDRANTRRLEVSGDARHGEQIRPSLRLVAARPARAESTRHGTEKQIHELKLTFGQLALVYKALQAAKTLGALPPQDELLNDTIQVVDLALNTAL